METSPRENDEILKAGLLHKIGEADMLYRSNGWDPNWVPWPPSRVLEWNKSLLLPLFPSSQIGWVFENSMDGFMDYAGNYICLTESLITWAAYKCSWQDCCLPFPWVLHLLCVLVEWAAHRIPSALPGSELSPVHIPGSSELALMLSTRMTVQTWSEYLWVPILPTMAGFSNLTKGRAQWFLTNLNHKQFISNFSTEASTNPSPVHPSLGVFRCAPLCTAVIVSGYIQKCLLWAL